jgi:hypothetical protein
VMGEEVERVELGPAPDVSTGMAWCGMCQEHKPQKYPDSWEPHGVCENCYWELDG